MGRKLLKIENMSDNRQAELRAVCRQYAELKEKLKQLPYDSASSAKLTGMPPSHRITDPTQKIAMKRLRIEQKIEAIERAALEADGEIYKWLIKSVTEGTTYHYLNVPCGRNQFYAKLKRFFEILDKKL